jgi:hypothetical protein
MESILVAFIARLGKQFLFGSVGLAILVPTVALADNYIREGMHCKISANQQDIDTPAFPLPYTDLVDISVVYVEETGNLVKASSILTPDPLATEELDAGISSQLRDARNAYAFIENTSGGGYDRGMRISLSSQQTYLLLKHLGDKSLSPADEIPGIADFSFGVDYIGLNLPLRTDACYQRNLPPNQKDGLSYHICYSCQLLSH